MYVGIVIRKVILGITCKIKRKINNLSIPEEEKNRLLDLLSDEDNSELELLELEESESSDWETDSGKDQECQCNNYKAIMDINGLSINKITMQEPILLDLIDSIEDKNQQRKIIEKGFRSK